MATDVTMPYASEVRSARTETLDDLIADLQRRINDDPTGIASVISWLQRKPANPEFVERGLLRLPPKLRERVYRWARMVGAEIIAAGEKAAKKDPALRAARKAQVERARREYAAAGRGTTRGGYGETEREARAAARAKEGGWWRTMVEAYGLDHLPVVGWLFQGGPVRVAAAVAIGVIAVRAIGKRR